MNRPAKWLILFLATLFLAATLLGCGTKPVNEKTQTKSKQALDAQTAALVNGKKITTEDFERRVFKKKFVLEAKGHNFNGPDRDTAIQYLRDSVVQDLVEEEVLLEEAEREGVNISDQQIDQVMKQIKSGFASEADFKKTMKSRGLTEDAIRKYNKMQLTKTALKEKHADYDGFIKDLVKKADIQVNDLVVDKLFQSV